MISRMTKEDRQLRVQRGRRKQEEAEKQRGKLGVLVENTYVFWNTAHTGYCYCRIEHGVETEIAECIPKTALDPYARVVFVREGPALVAVDPNSLDAVNVYGQSAPALGVPSQPMGNRGSGDWTPLDGNILLGDGVQFSVSPFVDVFETLIGYLRTGDAVGRTISGGVLTLGDEAVVIVSPSSGTTATLNTILMAGAAREVLLLAAAGCTITIANAADNLFVSSGANVEFTDEHIAFLYHDSVNGYVFGAGSGGDATTVTYTPTTPGDWSVVPSDVQEALDTLAAGSASGGINKDLFTQTADVTVANSTTPTTLLGAGEGSSLLPADYFTVGRTLSIDFSGVRSTALVAPNITFEIDLGGTVICLTATFADVGSLSGQQFHGHAEITCRTVGASGTVVAQGWVSLNSTDTVAVRAEMLASNPITLDTTVSQQVSPLITWGTASASNTITCQLAALQTIDPNIGGGGSGAYPTRYDIDPKNFTVVAGSALGWDFTRAGAWYAGLRIYQATGAINNEFSFSCVLDAGNYDLTLYGCRLTNNGIITFYLDGASIGTQDWYGSTLVNQVHSTSFTVSAAGYHVFHGLLATKNASSSDYFWELMFGWIKQASD